MPRDPRFPPVEPGPYVDAWPTAQSPQLKRPRPGQFTIGSNAPGVFPVDGPTGGGGAVSPPGSVPVYDLSEYVTLNGSNAYAVATTSTLILKRPSSWRNYIHLRNASGVGGANLYVEFGDEARADAAGVGGSIIRLAPNEQILLDKRVAQDDLYAIADAAGGILVVAFSVYSFPGP